MVTQEELHFTARIYNWYWSQVSQRLDDGTLESRRQWDMTLLHQAWSQNRRLLPGFVSFQHWFDAIGHLGNPIDPWQIKPGVYRTAYFMPEEKAVKSLLAFLEEKEPRKRYPRWVRTGGRWRKEWEPGHDAWLQKKEARDRKKAWRAMLRKDQDQSRPPWRRGPGRYHKKARSSLHRAWTKEQIERENWEAFWPKGREAFHGLYVWS
jgi:hypothetical protein